MEFEEKLKVVKPFKARTDAAEYVPRHGVSLAFIKQELAKVAELQTMRDLESLVRKVTEPFRCSFAELLLQHDSYKSCVVEEAEYFVCVAYDTKVEVFVDALTRFQRELEVEDIFVWVSVFALNQHFGRGAEQGMELPESWLKDSFEAAMADTKRVLFVLSPVNKPIGFERLWCFYELLMPRVLRGCILDVCLSEEDEQNLTKGLLEDAGSILEAIAAIDLEKTKCSNAMDERMLRKRLAAIQTDTQALNKLVRDQLRNWFMNAAIGCIASNSDEYTKEVAKLIDVLYLVGGMFEEAEDLDTAETLANEVLTLCTRHYGKEHEK